jgi:hypothetical protein
MKCGEDEKPAALSSAGSATVIMEMPKNIRARFSLR